MLDTAAAVKAAVALWFAAHPYYQAHQREAIYQRINVESTFQPCVIAKTGSAYLLQWTGSRKAALHRFTKTKGCPTVQQQLNFMDWELRSVDRHGRQIYHRFWHTRNTTGAYGVFTVSYERGR